MANRNPSPATRFSAERPGRAKQKGARDRLSAAFLAAFADDFEKHGEAVIRKARAKDPLGYLRVAATILPKEVALTATSPETDLTDDEIEALYQDRLAFLKGKKPKTSKAR